jgi:SUMO ligase MMS21 Smc5/6 complex component
MEARRKSIEDLPRWLQEAMHRDPSAAAWVKCYLNSDHVTVNDVMEGLARSLLEQQEQIIAMARDVLEKHSQPIIRIERATPTGVNDNCIYAPGTK